METMKVEAGDSRDENLRETFNPFTPNEHLRRPNNGEKNWYNYYPTKQVSTGTTNDIRCVACRLRKRKIALKVRERRKSGSSLDG